MSSPPPHTATVFGPDRLRLSRVASPIGELGLASDGAGRVRGLSFAGQDAVARSMSQAYPAAMCAPGEAPAAVLDGLAAYFAGDRVALDRVGWSLDGVRTDGGFQVRVWRALVQVPSGVTISYGEMARRAGGSGPEAARATGVALNRNPIPLILACHRVVGADGSMTGFGGGLERKTWLLRHEGALLI